jgi:diguanylate cyclase (GGDEF)-like protein
MNENILLVDDDPGTIQLLAKILSKAGNLKFATNGHDAMRVARESKPDLVLLDAEMPGMNGFQVCETLKNDPELADVPVIFVTSHSGAEFEAAGFEAGAADFIAKPVNASLVRARVKAQLDAKRMIDGLRRAATVDALTGIANRRRFDDVLVHEWQRARREGTAISLLMVDVDHFKAYNDRYGHPKGDACLRDVALALLRSSARPGDLVARFGGEEFVVLLPQTARRGAEQIAHRILDEVEALECPHEASETFVHLTVSIGIGCYDQSSPSWMKPYDDATFIEERPVHCDSNDLVQAADNALYAAKHAGRAQAKLLDIAYLDAPLLTCDLATSARRSSTSKLKQR